MTVHNPNRPSGMAPDLVSAETAALLQQVADMRAQGIAGLINLPQLVVCGDQSVGKSSVLEGLTGFAFPKKDGLCTRFPTEILLEHSNEEQTIVATIIPAQDRVEPERSDLESFSRTMSSFEDLPFVTTAAGEAMRIQGFGGLIAGPAFAEDVLRIKVKGNIGLHLSVVDLPGMIANPGEDQNHEDVAMVHRMVESYAKNPRTIILAVLQASSDIANQKIITIARTHDPSGQRTVGIITRTDLINKGTEAALAQLARNEGSHKLNLGFFLLKNPSPEEAKDIKCFDDRHKLEMRFFQAGAWKQQRLDEGKVGALALRNFLQELLGQHIRKELPSIREELRAEVERHQSKLLGLVEERQTIPQCRAHLTRLSILFRDLVISGSNGHYQDINPDFFDIEGTRLRAQVQIMNEEFANLLKEDGQLRKVCAPPRKPFPKLQDPNVKLAELPGPIEVSDEQFRVWVKMVRLQSRGNELPGDPSHIVLSELFHEQASRWPMISRKHFIDVYHAIVIFARKALENVIEDGRILVSITQRVEVALDELRINAEKEWKKLCDDEKHHPITYNSSYIGKATRACYEISQDRDYKSMEDEHIESLHAYYEVTVQTFVDNMSRQVIERHLLRPLRSLFSPEQVAEWKDEELAVAMEAPDRIKRREMLQRQVEDLRACLETFRF